MPGLTPSTRKMTGSRLLGAVLISICYLTAFLLLVFLADPFSPPPPRLSDASILTIGALMTVVVWAASGFIIGKYMQRPRRKAAQPWLSFVYAAILLLAIPGISALLAWKF